MWGILGNSVINHESLNLSLWNKKGVGFLHLVFFETTFPVEK